MKALHLVLFLLSAICAFWGYIVINFLFTTTTHSSSESVPRALRPRSESAPQTTFYPNRKRLVFPPITDAQPFQEGFDNPNLLPILISVGPPSFFHILAPPYYGKSPMDGSRNYEPGSRPREEKCGHVREIPHGEFALSEPLCSFGPELVYPLGGEGEEEEVYAAHLLHDVCLTLNVDSVKQVQRGLLYFDPRNSHPKRCVPCPNPIEFRIWGQHACGVMWNHQINVHSLLDYQTCYAENARFIAKIGQRQTDPNQVRLGYMHRDTPVIELSFAHSNPGHQCFDSLFSLLPILFEDEVAAMGQGKYQVIVHQNPTCPDSEWLCGILRRMGFFAKHELVEYNPVQVPCFANLVIPKWGMARESAIPPRLLQRLREELHASFAFDPTRALDNVLLYAHETVSVEVRQRRRIWEEMETSVAPQLANANVVKDFAALSIQEQGSAFYHANVVVMPHGGQFGNAIFARSGTIMIELACVAYSHLGMTSMHPSLFGSVPLALGFIHLVVVPCDCDEKSLDSNFRFGPQSLKALLELSKDLAPGTHLLSRNGGKKCFGSAE